MPTHFERAVVVLAAGAETVFQRVLDAFFAGEKDPRTVALLDA